MIGYIDPLYLLVALPAFLLSAWASFYTKSTFGKYSRVASASGYTGAQAAAEMLRGQGVSDVAIEPVRGMLTDHYDPTSKTLRLSEKVYGSQSLAAIGVACHEAGHALQHATHYSMLGLRTALVPAASIGSYLSYFFLFLGILMSRGGPGAGRGLLLIGIVLFSLAVLFTIVTLPVEWNASRRAKIAMVRAGIVSQQEGRAAGQVLNAAFLTYLAAAVSAVLTLLYYLWRAGLLGGRRD